MPDIVYFLKEQPYNEELRYSLRSVDLNMPEEKVWFYGGCPGGLQPDEHVGMVQTGQTKWERVNRMLRAACENDDITEDFYLFNDDFYIMQPMKKIAVYYNKTIPERIIEIENRHSCSATNYTRQLRKMLALLQKEKMTVKNYALHIPILINREKALETLDRFPDSPMFRCLYGNMHKIGGKQRDDVKIHRLNDDVDPKAEFLSSTDKTFQGGTVGMYIRRVFTEPSRFER